MVRTVRSGRRAATTRAWTTQVAAFFLGLMAVGVAAPTPAAAAGPDFTLTVSPTTQTLQPGSFVKFAVGVGAIDGFAEPVSLSVASDGPGGELPPGITGDFSPTSLVPPGTSFLTIAASDDAAAGSFGVVVTGSGGGITHTATGHAEVDFGLVPECHGAAEGFVTDRDTGDPIEGADVFGVSTDAAGHYFVELPLGINNSPQELDLTASKNPDYWSATKRVVAIGMLHEDGTCEAQIARADFEIVRVNERVDSAGPGGPPCALAGIVARKPA